MPATDICVPAICNVTRKAATVFYVTTPEQTVPLGDLQHAPLPCRVRQSDKQPCRMIVAIIRALIDCEVYRFFDKPFPVERGIGSKININEAHKHRRDVIGAHPQRGDTVFFCTSAYSAADRVQNVRCHQPARGGSSAVSPDSPAQKSITVTNGASPAACTLERSKYCASPGFRQEKSPCPVPMGQEPGSGGKSDQNILA
jgi:hypothetical protein